MDGEIESELEFVNLRDSNNIVPASGELPVELHAHDGSPSTELLDDDGEVLLQEIKHGSKHDSVHGIQVRRRSTRDKVRSMRDKARRKTEHAVHSVRVRAGLTVETVDEDSPYADIHNNPALNPDSLMDDKPLTVGGTMDKFAGTVVAAGKAIAHPRSTIKKAAATTVAVEDRPYLSQQADLEYLNAHEDLSRALSLYSNTSDEDGLDVNKTQSKVVELDKIREGKMVAWTMSKHIHRVMVVPKVMPSDLPEDKYYTVDKDTGRMQFDRRAYYAAKSWSGLKNFAFNRMGNIDFVGHPPFVKRVAISHIERMLKASSPWQSYVLSLRKLYRWEDPAKTGRWAAIWFFIWYMDYCVSFVLVYIAFLVLRNRFRPDHAEALRASYERARHGHKEAWQFNELISRHGSDDWMDPLIDAAGPLIQMQLSDFADFLEILSNFYEWKTPMKTWQTLFWFATAILLGALCETGYSVKIVWMFIYLYFFVARPVASRAPEYRHCVNGFKWVFWGIPTDGEWSLMYLRQTAQETRAKLIAEAVQDAYIADGKNPSSPAYVGMMQVPQPSRTEPAGGSGLEPDLNHDSEGDSFETADSSTSFLGGRDLFSFRCRWNGSQGNLAIYSGGLRFIRASPFARLRKEVWRRGWQDIKEMRKINNSMLVKAVASHGIWIQFTDGSIVSIGHVKGRDRAFNCILGFSGLQFQILTPEAPGKGKDGGKSEKGANMSVVGTLDKGHPLEGDDKRYEGVQK